MMSFFFGRTQPSLLRTILENKRNSSQTIKNAVFIWKQRSKIRSLNLKSFRSSRGRKIIVKKGGEKRRKEKAQCHVHPSSSNPFCFFLQILFFFSWVFAGCSNQSWNKSFRIKNTEKEIQKGIRKMPFRPHSFWARQQWQMISLPLPR